MPDSYLAEAGSRRARRRTSVRAEFLRLLIAVQVPILIVGLVQGLSSWSDARDSQIARLSENARAIAGLESNLLSGANAALGLLAAIPEVRKPEPACEARMQSLTRNIDAYSNLQRIAPDGRVLCSALPFPPGTTYADVDWWPEIATEDSTTIHGPLWGTLTKKPVLVAMKPLTDADGAFEGAVALVIDVPQLQHAVRSRHLAGNAVVALVDGEGKLIAANRDTPLPLFNVADAGELVHTASAADSGRRWSYAAAPLLQSPGMAQSIYVVFAEPHPEIFSQEWWRSLFVFLLPGLAVVLSSIAIWKGTDAVLLRWLVQLRALAQAFARGEYRARAPGLRDAPAELRDFAADLHRMALAIEVRDTKLTGALEEEQRLVREVHHRVRNNLQVMTSMLSLQAARMPRGAGRQALEQARIRMSALALVHHLGYASGEQGEISAQRLIPELAARFQADVREAAGLHIATDVADLPLALDTAVPIALWLSETLVQALRHAYPDGEGVISLRLSSVDGHAALEVADQGAGLAAGGDPAFGRRLGEAIARQLGGQSRMETLAEGGTVATLQFFLHKDGRTRIHREPEAEPAVT